MGAIWLFVIEKVWIGFWFWIVFGLVLESDLVLAPIWIWIGEGSPLL